MDHNANPATAQTLENIREFYAEDDERLSAIESIAEKYGFEGENHDIFWLIRNVRNANIHGELEDQFAPSKFTYIVVNLLCLLYWDCVDGGKYNNNIEEFISISEHFSSNNLTTRREDLYYPAFTSEIDFQYPSI